jgi:hypothetical protein
VQGDSAAPGDKPDAKTWTKLVSRAAKKLRELDDVDHVLASRRRC